MLSPKSLILKLRLNPDAKKPPKGAMIDANIASTTAWSCTHKHNNHHSQGFAATSLKTTHGTFCPCTDQTSEETALYEVIEATVDLMFFAALHLLSPHKNKKASVILECLIEGKAALLSSMGGVPLC
jgi:hypothetical protein